MSDPRPPPDKERLEEALAAAQKAIELNPTDAKSYSQVGLLLDRQGQPREAIAFLRAAVALNPKHAAHYDELGMVMRRAAISLDAHLSRSAGASARPPPPQRMPGGDDPCWRRQPDATCFELQFYTREQLHIAEDDFLRRVAADDSDARGFELLALYYRNRSTAACTTALKLDPNRPTSYLTLARLMPKGGSLTLYEHTLRLLPTQAVLYREFADILTELRYYGKANAAYRKAIALEPTSPLAYESLADLRLLRGRPDEAAHIAAQVLKLYDAAPDPPTAADANGAREGGGGGGGGSGGSGSGGGGSGGSGGGGGGRHGEPSARAERRARQAAERAASSPAGVSIAAAIALISEARVNQGRPDEAVSLARSAVSINPACSRGYVQLGRLLYEREEHRRKAMGEEQYDSLLRRRYSSLTGERQNAGFASYLHDFGGGGRSSNTDAADEQLSSCEAAIAACAHASKLAPGDAATRFRHGRLLRRIPGRLQEAITQFNGALIANATYPGARAASEEAVGKLHELRKPARGWRQLLGNLLPVLLLMGGMFHFTTP
jgi:tetratricopeptide (TPR) repeat protein